MPRSAWAGRSSRWARPMGNGGPCPRCSTCTWTTSTPRTAARSPWAPRHWKSRPCNPTASAAPPCATRSTTSGTSPRPCGDAVLASATERSAALREAHGELGQDREYSKRRQRDEHADGRLRERSLARDRLATRPARIDVHGGGRRHEDERGQHVGHESDAREAEGIVEQVEGDDGHEAH